MSTQPDCSAKFSRSIDDLGIGVRTANCLKAEGVNLIGDLVFYHAVELRKFPNLGKRTVDEIESALAAEGLALGMDMRGWPQARARPWTPGEWTVQQVGEDAFTVRAVYHDEQGRRCTGFVSISCCGGQPNKANAMLHAASNDLAEALIAAPRRGDFTSDTGFFLAYNVWLISHHNAALAKAGVK